MAHIIHHYLDASVVVEKVLLLFGVMLSWWMKESVVAEMDLETTQLSFQEV